MKKVVVLLSGGMDSVVLLYRCLKDYSVVATVSFDYGSKHNKNEIPYARYHSDLQGVPHKEIRMDFVNELFKSDLLQSGGEIPEGHYEEENMKSTVVPFRNGIMLAIATGYAESIDADCVAIAAHAGDHAIYPDCRDEFMEKMGSAMQLGTYNQTTLVRPFISMSKADIAKAGKEMGVDFSQTWSCYKGGDTHCGQCGTCVERREAFILSGVEDPTVYINEESLPEKPGSGK